MKKLLKKNKPTKAEYFKSESQRKRSNRIAFLYGHKPLVVVVSVLIVASAITGLVIVQKSRDSHAAVANSVSWGKNDANTALSRWQPTGTPGFTDFAEVGRTDRLTMSLKAGPVYPDMYQVCWAMSPGGVAGASNFKFTSANFAYDTNEAGLNGVAVYVDGQQMNVLGAVGHQGGAVFNQNITVDFSGLAGGGMQLGQTIKFCNVKLGTGKVAVKKTVNLYAYSFRASYDTPDPVVPVFDVYGTVKNNYGQAIPGVTITNCQTTTVTDTNGVFGFKVKQGSYYCVRTQGGLDPNVYSTVKATNANKGAINVGRSADGTSYENQQATARATNFDFTAYLKQAPASVSCTNTGSGSQTEVEAEKALCKEGTTVIADGSTQAAALKAAGQSVEYTFTAPSAGTYQAVARMRNATSTAGTVDFEYIKLNPGASSELKREPGKSVSGGTSYVNYTPRESGAGVQTNSVLTQTLNAGQQVIIRVKSTATPDVYVDKLFINKTADATPTTPNPTPPAPAPVSNEKSSNANCAVTSTSTGLTTPTAATEGIKSGSAINTTIQGKKAVLLQKDGDYVQCMVKLPAGAEAGGYVLAYSGTASVGPGQSFNGTGSPSGDYAGTRLKLSMAGGNGGTQTATKTAGIVSSGTFAVDRMPIIRKTSSDFPTVRFIRPGEKVVARITLDKPTANYGLMYIENLQFFKDPCMDGNGNVIQDGRDLGGGVKCDPPKSTTPAPPAPANPAPAANTGDAAAAAAAVAKAAKCSNDATGNQAVEAERAVCVPNSSDPATVTKEGDLKVVNLRNSGQYVEFSFKNNKTPGKYRAFSIIRSTGGSPYIIYHLTKERPGAMDTTTAQALNVPTSFRQVPMNDSAKYVDLTKDEISQGVTLKVRVTFTKVFGAYGPGSSATMYVDKIGIERVGEVNSTPVTIKLPPSLPPLPPLPQPIRTGTGGSGDDQTKVPSTSSSGSSTKTIPTTTGGRVVTATNGTVTSTTNNLRVATSRAYIERRNACINAFYRTHPELVLKHMYLSPSGGCQPEVMQGVVRVIEAG